MTVPTPDDLAWASRQLGAEIVETRGLRAGGAPWLLTAADGRGAVLRVGDVDELALERAAMTWAGDHGIPVPRVLSDGTPASTLLIEPVAATSVVPADRPTARLETMGAIAARVHAVPPPRLLPRRLRSVNGVDFVALWDAVDHPLRDRARAALTAYAPHPDDDGFVHGDLWMGNVLWDGDESVAVIDWDCAGSGPATIDLGSARCDAATAYGVSASADVLRGWERQAGRPAADVAQGDVVAALCTPPDMGWFATAIQQQGRQDLTAGLLVQRRDAFLERALDELGF